MSKCPKCYGEITSLNYLQYDKGRGEIELVNNEIKIIRPKTTSRTYYFECPTCKKILYYTILGAAKWLITGEYVKEEFPETFWS